MTVSLQRLVLAAAVDLHLWCVQVPCRGDLYGVLVVRCAGQKKVQVDLVQGESSLQKCGTAQILCLK